jgi:tetratricopeptide (TPR) repeat protein
MRTVLATLICLTLFWSGAGATTSAPGSNAKCEAETLVTEANKLMEAAKDNQALKKFEEALKSDPVNYEALWKISLLNTRIGLRYDDLLTQQNYFENAWYYADAALCAKPDGSDANYVMALAVYHKANNIGMKERMQRTQEIKYFLDVALCENPRHADALQLLARWHYRNANLNLAEKTAFKMFYGNSPSEASNEEAIEALQRAIKYNPSNISYYYDLACIYREMEKNDLCEVTLQEASELKILTTEELEISRRCKLMLREIEKA